jgi:hypothetical protein
VSNGTDHVEIKTKGCKLHGGVEWRVRTEEKNMEGSFRKEESREIKSRASGIRQWCSDMAAICVRMRLLFRQF